MKSIQPLPLDLFKIVLDYYIENNFSNYNIKHYEEMLSIGLQKYEAMKAIAIRTSYDGIKNKHIVDLLNNNRILEFFSISIHSAALLGYLTYRETNINKNITALSTALNSSFFAMKKLNSEEGVILLGKIYNERSNLKGYYRYPNITELLNPGNFSLLSCICSQAGLTLLEKYLPSINL